MVAFVRDRNGRAVNARATPHEVAELVQVGDSVAAVVGGGGGKLVQGEVAAIDRLGVTIGGSKAAFDQIIAVKFGGTHVSKTATTRG